MSRYAPATGEANGQAVGHMSSSWSNSLGPTANDEETRYNIAEAFANTSNSRSKASAAREPYIRLATPADLEALAELATAAFIDDAPLVNDPALPARQHFHAFQRHTNLDCFEAGSRTTVVVAPAPDGENEDIIAMTIFLPPGKRMSKTIEEGMHTGIMDVVAGWGESWLQVTARCLPHVTRRWIERYIFGLCSALRVHGGQRAEPRGCVQSERRAGDAAGRVVSPGCIDDAQVQFKFMSLWLLADRIPDEAGARDVRVRAEQHHDAGLDLRKVESGSACAQLVKHIKSGEGSVNEKGLPAGGEEARGVSAYSMVKWADRS
ncbi:hypothetical protein EVG20_g5108 [Dentipellis fragilis]|uniref:Uncharacterized protein n=1 Tax=Dentipellis fragilis TaxID=205917 RepID=A0A4Y9YW54_9AGAM|nr:hypothetical protein EVG20_g5108 [Dentipellis fragilis]